MPFYFLLFLLGSMFGACALTAASNAAQRILDWKPPAVWALGLLITATVVAWRHS